MPSDPTSAMEPSAPALSVHIPLSPQPRAHIDGIRVVPLRVGQRHDILDALQREIDLQSEHISGPQPIAQLHWSAGIALHLDDAQMTQLMHTLATHFPLGETRSQDYTVELDPGPLRRQSIALLKGLGFNHIVLDIQDFDPLVQKATKRLRTFDQVADLVRTARAHRFASLGIKLCHGLPYQDEESILQTIEKVVSLGPDRIICQHHGTAILERHHLLQADNPQSTSAKTDLRGTLWHALHQAGYVPVGLDHFVRPEDKLATASRDGSLWRNLLGYSCLPATDIIGLGLGAVSHRRGYRIRNTVDLDEYSAMVGARQLPVAQRRAFSMDDRLRQHIVNTLACHQRVALDSLEREFDIDFHDYFGEQVPRLMAMRMEGLLIFDQQALAVSNRGRPHLQSICALFDNALQDPAEDSKTTPKP